MNAIKRKAKAGVTLVELLVVVLIVTILSVSLLPLLKPFVVEAQYAAEAIPVIGNLRTKIGLYQYDKGKLPAIANAQNATAYNNAIETWGFANAANASTVVSGPTDVYVPAYRALPASSGTSVTATTLTAVPATPETFRTEFFGTGLDVDNQDLAGKRCKPVHFQYVVLKNGSEYCYVIGCFGDGNGLPKGTGYAVCELNVKGSDNNIYKKIGTWKRYKAATDEQIIFASINGATTDSNAKKTCSFCPVPAPTTFSTSAPQAQGGNLTLLTQLKSWGWEFD